MGLIAAPCRSASILWLREDFGPAVRDGLDHDGFVLVDLVQDGQAHGVAFGFECKGAAGVAVRGHRGDELVAPAQHEAVGFVEAECMQLNGCVSRKTFVHQIA
jgi:hypothetical protein